MIDEKKIEEAAAYYAEENAIQVEDQWGDMITDTEELSEAYKEGAHLAINEFLKDLWHPAEEEPKVGERVFTHNEDDDTYKVITWFTMWYTWDGYKDIDHIDKWLYIDDLLPKEGGEK